MGKIVLTFLTVIVLSGVVSCSEFGDFVDNFSAEYGQMLHDVNLRRFELYTNKTDSNQKRVDEAVERYVKFIRNQAPKLSAFKSEANSRNKENRNAFHTIASFIDTNTLSRANEKKLKSILNKLKAQSSGGSGSILDIMFPLTPEDYNSLLKKWDDRRKKIGWETKGKYNEFVQLSNSAAGELGYNDAGEFQRSRYGPGIEDDLQRVIGQLRPLYEQVHALIRRKLKSKYGSANFLPSGRIPAHLLSGTWDVAYMHGIGLSSISTWYDIDTNIASALQKQYTVEEGEKLFKFAEKFFQSIGLTPAPETFWKRSVFGLRFDGCLTTALNLHKGNDVRVIECQRMDQNKLQEAIGLMAYVHNCLETTDLKHIYREGPYLDFRDVVMRTISLLFFTPQHLSDVGLYPNFETDHDKDINALLGKAVELDRLMFHYVEEKWRWGVFRGDIEPRDYNYAWWKLRGEYQGLAPSSNRSAPRFDPGIYEDIANNKPQIGGIVNFILKFQFLKAMCDASGHIGPLIRCDIGNSTAAGVKLSNMLKVGGSEPLSETITRMTGQPKLQAQPLLDYFQPLMEYLQKENGKDVGWENSCPCLV